MKFSADQYVLLDWGWGRLTLTLVVTWLEMALLALGSWLVTRRLASGLAISRWQNLLEVVVEGIVKHIEAVTRQRPEPLLPFIGTLFLFILVSNLLSVVPFFLPPTGSLSTTVALALCVFVAVPVYGVSTRGLVDYLAEYVRPTVLMLPFNIVGEFSRTFALAVRLYGNLLAGTVIGMVLLLIAPLVVPVIMHLLGLLTGVIQAYIFALLAMVYIASAMKREEEKAAAVGGVGGQREELARPGQ